MNKNLLALLFITPFLILGFHKTSFSKKNSAPAQQTGADMEPSCGFSSGSTNTCHGSLSGNGESISELLSLNTDITLLADGDAVNSSFKYVPDKTYLMTFKIISPSSRNGFSLTVIKNSTETFAGNISIPSGSDAELSSSNSNYVGHTNSLGVNEWTFNWSAPASGNGDITFYASANKGNNNDQASGDQIIPFKMEISEKTSTGVSELNIKDEILIKNNPLFNNTLSFDLYVNEPKQYFITVYDLTGKVVLEKQFAFHVGLKEFNETFDQKGLFILNVRTNKNENASFKIFN